MSPVPEPVAFARDLMSTFGAHWALCGGWAVDGWLGRTTRHHGDIDITAFAGDQQALFEHLDGWQLIAHDTQVPDDTTEPWDGRQLHLPAHIHARSEGAPELEVLVNEQSGAMWIFGDDQRLARPIAQCVREHVWGIPMVSPEVLLYYKATAYFRDEAMQGQRVHDEADFDALLPLLSKPEGAWLAEAIAAAIPAHPWLAKIVG